MGAANDAKAEPAATSNQNPDTKEKILESGRDSAASISEESLADAEGYGSSRDHIFSDPAVADYWRGVYEKAGYENRHRFQPDFTWTAEEERRVLRKIDFRIMVW